MAKELPLEEIKALVGREVYVSGWKEVGQGQEKPACVAESLALFFMKL